MPKKINIVVLAGIIIIILLASFLTFAFIKINQNKKTESNQTVNIMDQIKTESNQTNIKLGTENIQNITSSLTSSLSNSTQNIKTENPNTVSDDQTEVSEQITSEIIQPISGTNELSVNTEKVLDLYKVYTLKNGEIIYKVDKNKIDESVLNLLDNKQLLQGEAENKTVGVAILIYNPNTKKIRYAGYDIDNLYDYTVNNQIFWFYSTNSYGSGSLYVSLPDFKESKELESLKDKFIKYIETGSKNAEFVVYTRRGNGQTYIDQSTIDLTKSFTDPKANIVTNFLPAEQDPEQNEDQELQDYNGD